MASSDSYSSSAPSISILIPLIVTIVVVGLGGGGVHSLGDDSEEEMQKCVEQLEVMVKCLPYVAGAAKAPTPECCTGFNQAIKTVNRCVCLVVKDRNHPRLGFYLNITLVLRLPDACQAPENFSHCPAILHLDPLSPEAQAFNQFNTTRIPPASTSAPPPPASDEANSTWAHVQNSTSGKNEAAGDFKKTLLVGGLLLWISITTF